MPRTPPAHNRFVAVVAAVTLAAITAIFTTGTTAGAASAAATVSVTVASATDLDSSGCASGTSGVTDLGTLLPAMNGISTADCTVLFGSSNDTAALRLAQADAQGVAMFRPTIGQLDTTFDGGVGANGIVFDDVDPANDDRIYKAVEQPDGKILASGSVYDGTRFKMLVMRFLPDGTLDPGFDGNQTGNGILTFQAGATHSWASALALEPDGSILVAGSAVTPNWAVMKLQPDGTPDPTFGAAGLGTYVVPGSNMITDMAVQPDGKIVLAGFTGAAQMETARVLADGSGLDPAYDGPGGSGNGAFVADAGGTNRAEALMLRPTGEILLSGQSQPASDFEFTLVQLQGSNGDWDTSFGGGDGIATADVLPGAGNDDIGRRATLQSDGKVVVIGDTASNSGDLGVARFDVNGSLDPTFGGGDGMTAVDIAGDYDTPYDVKQTADGKLLVVGSAWNGTTDDIALIRLAGDGSLDTSLVGDSGTGNGKVVIDAGADDYVNSIVVQHDGRIALAGSQYNPDEQTMLVQLDSTPVADFLDNTDDWTLGTNAFGACLDSIGGGVGGDWTVAGAGNCASANDADWNGVPTLESDPGAKVAHTTASGTSGASVALRFGIRTASNQAAGSYIAPLVFDVIAPDA